MNSSINKKKTFCIVAVVLLTVVLLVGLLLGINQAEKRSVQQPLGNQSNKLHELPSDVNGTTLSGSIVGYTLSEITERSSLVVYGRIEEISDSFAVKWVGGGGSHMTDITVKPIKILRGVEQDYVTMRVLGGLVSDIYEDWEEVPEFQVGEEWLLFLYQPNTGGGYFLDDDSFYLSALYLSAFKQMDITSMVSAKNSRIIENDDVVFINSRIIEREDTAFSDADMVFPQTINDFEGELYPINTCLTLTSLEGIMPQMNKLYPYDSDMYRDESLAAYKGNYERGFITKEEYEKFVGDLDVYAHVVAEEEYYAVDSEIEKQKDELRQALEDYEKNLTR